MFAAKNITKLLLCDQPSAARERSQDIQGALHLAGEHLSANSAAKRKPSCFQNIL